MSQKPPPILTFITPTLNAVETLRDTIEAVRREASGYSYEHIVVDGVSTDGTQQWVQSQNDEHLVLISEPDRGVYDAMNKGIRVAKGDFICIINSDDYYCPGSINRVYQYFQDSPECLILLGSILMDKGTSSKVKRPTKPYLSKFGIGYPLFHPAMFVRKEAYEQIGLYRTDLMIASDQDWALKAIDSKKNIKIVRDVLSTMRAGGMSHRFYKTTTMELLDIYRSRTTLSGRVSHVLYYLSTRLRKHPDSASGLSYIWWAINDYFR